MNVTITLENHEDSIDYDRVMVNWVTGKSNKNIVGQQLVKQVRKNMQYYFEILKRIVFFFSESGLEFRSHKKK